MSSNRKKRKFSAKFKTQVALEAIKEQRTVHEIAEVYELHPNQVTHWKKAFLEQASTAFEKEKKSDKAVIEQERDQLFKKVGQLQVEVDFLKKSLGER